MLPNEETLKENCPVTLEQDFFLKRLDMLASENPQEFKEIALGMISYQFLRENWLLEELKGKWGL